MGIAMKPNALPIKLTHLYDDNDWIAEVKYDGERYMCRLTKENNICFNKFTSLHKNKDTGKYVEKTDRLPHLNNLKHDLDGTIIDGEIVGKNLQYTVSVTGSLASRAISLQKKDGWLNYRVFDILKYKGKDIRNLPYLKRRKYVKKVVEELNCKYVKCSSASRNKKELLSKVYNGNGEGIVLKHIESIYVEGKKHKSWYKVKKEIMVDAVIIGYEYGKGKYNKNKIGAIIYGAYNNGKLEQWGTVGSMTKEIILTLTNNPDKYLNQVIEIECQGYTEANNLRHPRFKRMRNDKQPKECVKGRQI
jgi:bifunctional non-homologous end joining protein LigD